MYLAQGNWNSLIVPSNIKHLYSKQKFDTLADAQIYLAELIEEHCPVNIFDKDINWDNIYFAIQKFGYARLDSNKNKIMTFDDLDMVSSVYLIYVDETRPWTIVELEEYSTILYLDNFETKAHNYHLYKKD